MGVTISPLFLVSLFLTADDDDDDEVAADSRRRCRRCHRVDCCFSSLPSSPRLVFALSTTTTTTTTTNQVTALKWRHCSNLFVFASWSAHLKYKKKQVPVHCIALHCIAFVVVFVSHLKMKKALDYLLNGATNNLKNAELMPIYYQRPSFNVRRN